MSAALVGVVLMLQTAVGPSQRRDPWFGVDKVKHFFTSFFVQSVVYGSARATGAGHGGSLGAASAATAVVGITKELRDRRSNGVFSARDLVWDAAGAGLATVMLRRTVR